MVDKERLEYLKQTVRDVVAGYAGKVLNGYSFLTQSDDGSVYTVVDMAQIKGKHISGVSLVVRIVADKVIVDALLQQGIKRENIILAYAGGDVPELMS